MKETNGPATVVFAKVPGIRIAKSRIAATLGWKTAETIYLELLEATSESLSGIPFYVAFTGADSPGALSSIFTDATGFFAQHPGDLGTRLTHAFEHLYRSKSETVCAIGCDCPDLSPDDIVRAHRLMQQDADVVVGPSEDGGYYLVGCRPDALDIFQVSSWSSASLLGDTIEKCAQRDYRVAQLAMKNDIDTEEDYRRWKESAG